MKQSEFSIFCNRMNRNVRLKNFSIFFDVADGMILCGRNVAFHVWEGRILIESETMEKETRFEVFTSNLAKYLVHPKETAGYQILPERKFFPARRNLSGISRSQTSPNTINIFKWHSMVLYFSKSSSGKSVLASDFALSGEMTE